MVAHFQTRYNVPVLVATAILAIFLVCSKKNNPVSTNGKPEQKVPTLTIITPANDTSVAAATDSVAVQAVIANSSSIDSLKINGLKISIPQSGGDTVSIRVKLDADTTKIIAIVYYQDTSSLKDSVMIYKQTPLPELNGMAKISGTLLQESSSPLAKRLSKKLVALNAQGTQAAVEKAIPVSGADIMVYNAEALSTFSDTSVKTDSLGTWSVTLEPGKYFMFAVYFDRENLEIITTALPDISAEKDKETKTDTAIAASDDISPMLMTFLDAAEANSKNMFIGSDIPQWLPIIMSFSEPMTRASAGDSMHGIVVGTVNADSSELPLIDTIPVRKLWGPNGKELRMAPVKALVVGATYKVIIPSATKDLALNKLDKEYIGIFEVADAASLPSFALKTTTPANNDSIQSSFPIECIFTRPVDGLSLNKQFYLFSESDSSMTGFFEVKGNVASFVNKTGWQAGAKYTLTIRAGTRDLLGDSLGTATAFSFFVKPKDAFDQKIGIEGMVASAVKIFTGAYIAGDIEKFSQGFHPAFELIESSHDGQMVRLQLGSFLEKMRSEIEVRNRLTKYGIIDPVFYYPFVNGTRHIAWKLIKGTTSVYFEDLGSNGGIGKVPRVISLDNKDITDSVRYVNRGIILHGDTLYFAPDMSKAFIDENTRINDPTIFGKLLRSATNVETRDIMLNIKNNFIIRNLTAQEGKDTAAAMIELITEEQYQDGQCPGPLVDTNNLPPAVVKRIIALQTKLVFTSGKWLVLQMAAKELFSGDKTQFNQATVADTAFVIQNFEQTRPIEFISPKFKSVSVTTPITFEWSVARADGIGGYLIAIANELSGGSQGLLVFTRKTTLTVGGNGAVDSNATILSIDPRTLSVPLPRFTSRLASVAPGDSAVYVWKVVGIADTSVSTIKSGTPLRVIADSDFGTQRGMGIFTLMDKMPDISIYLTEINQSAIQTSDRFADRDGDKFPDWIEKAFFTSPDDPGSYPNFSLDTDLDGCPDFLEQLAGAKIDDASSKPVDSDPPDGIPDMIQKRPEWCPELAADDDKDGFPNEIEVLFGTDPWNAQSKPSKSIKASVPVNTYFGGIKLGDQWWKRINVSLLSDTTGDYALLDTTELEGLARNGVDLTVKLFWNNGEWMFYLGIVNGPNTGKFIKVRFHREGANLRGPVDMADQENGGGPCIGEFFASIDSIKDFSAIGSGTPITIVNPFDQGTLNIGTPPMDRVKRPDSGSADMKLSLSFTESVGPAAVVFVNGDSVSFDKPFWSPGQYPALGGNDPASPKQYRIEASLYRLGTTASSADTLVLMGIIEFNKDNGGGGFIRQKFDFILFATGLADPRKPAGIWRGWYTQPMGPVNEGPKPFIGLKDSIDAALARTEKKGILMETQTIVMISSVAMEGNIWTAKIDTVTWLIMEKMGDYTSVMIKLVDNKPYIVLSGKGPNNGTGPNPEPLFFMGDSAKIVAALSASSNRVKVAAPMPFVITVDPATLHKASPDASVNFQWIASEAGNQQRKVVFLAAGSDNNALKVEDNNPVVFEIVQQPKWAPFSGDTMIIHMALNNSNNQVILDVPNAAPITINPLSVQRIQAPDDPQRFGYAVSAAGNAADIFIFMGDAQNPQVLRMKGNIPMVFKK